MYGGRNGYLFQRMAVSENAVADMDDFVRNVDSCKAVASFECGIAEIDHGGGQRDRREGNTAGKTVAFELQQSLGELYFVRLLQSANTWLPSRMALSGMDMRVRPWQEQKAALPILLSVVDRVSSCKW